MILLGLGVAVAALAAVALAGGERLRPAPFRLLLLLYLAPAAFLALLVLLAPADAHRLRYALLGVGFRGAPDAALEIAVGGDRAEHPLWISAIDRGEGAEPPPAAGVVRLDPRALAPAPAAEPEAVGGDEGGGPAADGDAADPAGEPAVTPAVAPGPLTVAPGPRGGGLVAVVENGRTRPVAALELEAGDRVTAAGETWTVERGWLTPAALVAEGSDRRLELPRRTGEVPVVGWKVPLLRVYAGSQQTYPLPTPTAPHDLPDGGPFLFFEPAGLAGGRLFLVAPAGGGTEVTVERAGEPVAPPAAVGLEPGGRLHALSPPRPGRASDDEDRAGGWRDRRSVRVLAGDRSVAFVYDTPEVYSLGPEALELLRTGDAPAEEGADRRVALSMGTWQVAERSLHFRHASSPVASEALANLALPEALLARWRLWTGELAAATPRGVVSGRYGEPFWLGDRHAAAVQVDVLRPPLVLALLGLVLALAKAAAAQAVRLPGAAAAVAAALDGLVALRLALGYRAWAAEPFRPETMELALVAWALLPWAFLVAAAPAEEGDERAWRAWLLPAAGLLFSLAWCVRLGGGGLRPWVWAACHLAALAVPLARWGHERWGHLTADRRRRLARSRLAERWRARPALGWSLVALAFLVVRVALLLLGFRESLQLGQRFALSLVHVPAAVLVQAGYLAWLWRRGEARGRLEAAELAPALAIVAFVWALPAFLVSDLGLALLGLPVFLLALVGVLWALRRRDVRLVVADGQTALSPRALWLRRAVVAGLVLVLAGYAVGIVSPLGARALVAAIPEGWRLELESERNFLRFMGFAYPDALAEVGRRSSEELAIMAAVMGAYTGGPVGGRGWFGSEWSPHIASTALREHVPSAFVAGAWGLAGTLGLVALYLVLAWGGAAPAPWRRGGAEEEVFAGVAATLAAWTLAVGGLYMVAANYRLTMFTGKNAYLLGLDSTADVLESLVLALVVAAGFAVVRDREGVR